MLSLTYQLACALQQDHLRDAEQHRIYRRFLAERRRIKLQKPVRKTGR
ncbi:MAG: hypothetical protein K8I82_15775 [Anaerolineae bacterium]|nr:hypothetical protein [Anaerolineae bacterium]